jgi:hypothetical protein
MTEKDRYLEAVRDQKHRKIGLGNANEATNPVRWECT